MIEDRIVSADLRTFCPLFDEKSSKNLHKNNVELLCRIAYTKICRREAGIFSDGKFYESG